MAEHLAARLDHDGSVTLRRDVAQRYRHAMDAALRQARHRHPEGQVPADLLAAQEVLRLAASQPSDDTGSGCPAGGTETVAVRAFPAPLVLPGMVPVHVAASRVGRTPSAIRKAIARGNLAATWIGRAWWITEHDLDEYRKARKTA